MLSGIVFLFYPSGGGFQGGRNAYFATTILGMDRWVLKDLHTWSSILMGFGVLGHIVLHWNWFVCMTRNIFARAGVYSARQPESEPATAERIRQPKSAEGNVKQIASRDEERQDDRATLRSVSAPGSQLCRKEPALPFDIVE